MANPPPKYDTTLFTAAKHSKEILYNSNTSEVLMRKEMNSNTFEANEALPGCDWSIYISGKHIAYYQKVLRNPDNLWVWGTRFNPPEELKALAVLAI